jgi:hypothetical protein
VRTAATAGAVVLAAAVAASTPVERSLFRYRTDVTVVYVGADDCAPCRIWRREHWPKFRASDEFMRVDYREVTAPKLFDLLNDAHWPHELRAYRAKLDRTAGVPLWFVVANDQLAVQARGLRQWKEVALPAIRSLVPIERVSTREGFLP